MQLPAGAGPVTLTLVDAPGRPVRAFRAGSIRQELDLTGVPAGIYALRVRAGRLNTRRRLVVE